MGKDLDVKRETVVDVKSDVRGPKTAPLKKGLGSQRYPTRVSIDANRHMDGAGREGAAA